VKGFKSAKVAIHIQVDGFVFTENPRLAVHLNRGEDFKVIEPESWAVTHVPTGKRITATATKRKAVAMVHALAHLDWNFDKPENLPKEFIAEVNAAIAKAEGRS
jgi:hypothetical protein